MLAHSSLKYLFSSTSSELLTDGAGVRSQLAQWVNAGVVVVVLVFLSGAIAKLPQPALAALVVARALHMIEPKTFRAIARVRRDEWAWAIVTVVGVVLIGTLDGILIAVAISIATLFYQSSHPPVYAVAYNRALESLPKRRAARHRRGLPRSADVAHRRPAGVPNPGPRPRRIYAPAVPTSTVRRQCPSPARLTAQNTWPMPKYHRRLPP